LYVPTGTFVVQDKLLILNHILSNGTLGHRDQILLCSGRIERYLMLYVKRAS